MFCRRAWQRLGPLARSAVKQAPTNVAPARPMSFGIPGGSTNMTYFVLCGGGLTAAVVYAYKTVNGDSERYDDRLASMASNTKAPAAEAAPEVVVEAEAAPVEETAATTEVTAQSDATAEPVAETAAEPIVESVSEEAAAPAAEVVAETAAEPTATEEAAPPVAVTETAPEEAPVVVEAVATEEAPAEAPATESADSQPDLLAAVKILAGSTVEIAAASVGETSLVSAVRQMDGDGTISGALESTVEGLEPEVLAETKEEVAEEVAPSEADETAVIVNEEKPAEAPAVTVDASIEEAADIEDAEAPAAEEVIAEKTPDPAAADEEDPVAPPPEDVISAAPVVEEEGEAEVDTGVQTSVPEAAPSAEASPNEAVSVEEVAAEVDSLSEEATPEEEAAPAEQAPDAEAAVEAPAAEEAIEEAQNEAAPTVDTNQLAAASAGSDLEILPAAEPESTSEAPVKEAEHCHSCHAAPVTEEEVAPPAALGEQEEKVTSDGAVELAEEAKEAVPLGEGQTTETLAVVTSQS